MLKAAINKQYKFKFQLDIICRLYRVNNQLFVDPRANDEHSTIS